MDYTKVKLGRKPAKFDKRTLKLGDYLPHLPTPLDEIDWTHGMTSWGMMLNDDLGDCTIAGCAHAVQGWTVNTVGLITPSDSVVKDYYIGWDGYVDGNPATDQGGIELDVLTKWQNSDFNGQKIVAFAEPDPGNLLHVKQSISLFGGLYIGLDLPLTAQGQDVWDVVGDPTKDPRSQPGSWGGHAVWVLKYQDKPSMKQGLLTCVTWGELKDMTFNFWRTYCSESHAILANVWLEEFGGDGLVVAKAMQNALAAIKG